jgi:hypothetical protein
LEFLEKFIVRLRGERVLKVGRTHRYCAAP